MILFSVIIPTYNRAYLVAETLDTVLGQTYPHFEVIIVDDGSTDQTKELIWQRYSAEPRVRYFFKQNEERAAARNFGLKQANGDYAVFLDSDDRMKPHYLDTLNNVIENDKGVFLMAAKYDYIQNGNLQHHLGLTHLREGWYDREFFLKGNILACNYAVRIREKNYKLFPEDRELASMEDWLFLLQNLEKNKIFIKDKICVTMRQHDDRSMMNNQKVIAARKKATGWVLQHLDLAVGEQKKLKAWSHYFCGIHRYLDQNRKKAIAEAFAAMRTGGLKRKFVFLLVKSIIGRSFIQKLK